MLNWYKMTKHINRTSKERKQSCPKCLVKTYNRCNLCSNKKCMYDFSINRKTKLLTNVVNKSKKKLIYDIETVCNIYITNSIIYDISYNWIKIDL